MKNYTKWNKMFLTAMTAMVLSFGLMGMSCDNGDGDGDQGIITTDLTYSASTGDYVIVIEKNSSPNLSVVRAADLQTGSTYKMYYNGNLVSSGTVTVSGQTVTFTCSYGNRAFSATVDGTSLNFANNNVPTNDGSTIEIPVSFSEQTYSAINPFPGTWIESRYGGEVVVTNSTWHYTNPYGTNLSGTYTHIGNTATYQRNNSSNTIYVTTIIDGVFHTEGCAFHK